MRQLVFALLLAPASLLLVLAPQPSAGARPAPFDNYADASFAPVIHDFPVRSGGSPATQPPAPAPRPLVLNVPRALAAPPSVADAKAYARSRLGTAQYACLDAIATRESHWNPYDLNRSSGAYGIPQAVPGSKMGSAGADWQANPVTQVRWMIGYVNGRYGSACEAWAFWRAHGWY